MMARLLALGISLTLLASCATQSSGPEGTLDLTGIDEIEIPRECGVMAGQLARIKLRPPLEDDLVPPCEPINAAQIAYACSIRDSYVTYDADAPEDARPRDFYFADYSVESAECSSANDEGSLVSCDFDLSKGDDTIRVSNQQFRYEYWEEHGPTSHWYNAAWSTGESCHAPADEG